MFWRRPSRREVLTLTAAWGTVGIAGITSPREKPYQRLQRFWQETRDPKDDPRSSFRTPSTFRAGNTEAAVAALEFKYQITIPTDFRDYLLHGMPLGENWDSWGTNWWWLDRIRSVREEFPDQAPHASVAHLADKTLFFADWLIWCGAWAIVCSDGPERGKIVCQWSEKPAIVADNFGDFVERYIVDFGDVTG